MNIFLISDREFYDKLPLIKFNLKNTKHKIILPIFKSGKISKFSNEKQVLFRKNIRLLKDSDAILIANFKKHNKVNYISNEIMMIMAVADYLNKKIYVLYDLPKDIEELKLFDIICLSGDIKELR